MPVLLFNGATLNIKPITTMYTNAKIDGYSIKPILDSKSTGSIITRQLMDQLGHLVDCTASSRIITANKATKMPIGKINNLPIEINSIIVLIKKKKEKPIWEAYQVFWADEDHNELLLILSWDNKGKRKQKKKPTWNTNQA
ncbi:hypothetical protein G9A89_022261 [Geosiphon pyriformis]|nr:hypothetical protein G9A89_022261 [Geosiphon pyriformis]